MGVRTRESLLGTITLASGRNSNTGLMPTIVSFFLADVDCGIVSVECDHNWFNIFDEAYIIFVRCPEALDLKFGGLSLS